MMNCTCEKIKLVIEKIKEEICALDKAGDQAFKKGNTDAWKIAQSHIAAYKIVLGMLDISSLIERKGFTFFEKIKFIFGKKDK